MGRRLVCRAHRGFTLVELLVVIAIIGILVALLLPAIQAAREAGRRSSCSNNLHELAIGLHNFHDVFDRFPAGAQQDTLPDPNPTGSTSYFRGTSWIVHILPFIEQKGLYDRYRFDLAYNSSPNAAIGHEVLKVLYCPSGPDPQKYRDPNGGAIRDAVTTHYYGVMGPAGPSDNFRITVGGIVYQYREGDATNNAAWSYHGILSQYKDRPGSISTKRVVRMADVLDGTAHTLMVGEISKTLPIFNNATGATQPNQYRAWVRGNSGGSGATKNVRYPINSTFYNGSNNFNNLSFGSDHAGDGAMFAMSDASVRFIRENIDLTTYIFASSMNGNEPALVDANQR
ncbi:MAG TPA: DUF1559 domain-containing protein [Pirellulaceae bacterium]|nr:DUF1559 domain-containing protein [Pirellulaceae bacterium]